MTTYVRPNPRKLGKVTRAGYQNAVARALAYKPLLKGYIVTWRTAPDLSTVKRVQP